MYFLLQLTKITLNIDCTSTWKVVNFSFKQCKYNVQVIFVKSSTGTRILVVVPSLHTDGLFVEVDQIWTDM